MSTTRLSPSPDLERLREEGYEVFLHRAGYVVVDNVPYLTSDRQVGYGRLVTNLELSGDVVVPPRDHVVLWAGDVPCDTDGRPLRLGGGQAPNVLADDLVVDRTFSSKPVGGYADYHDKLSKYALAISGPAASIDHAVTAMTYGRVDGPDDEDDSPFEYLDTSASRSRITGLVDKLRLARVAIIGCGGTGSYILDLVAKTPVRQIDVYDADRFRQHNAFRAPGAAPKDDLRGGPNKAEYFAARYRALHKNVVPHPYALDEATADELAGADFVFVAVDRGSAKKAIFAKLEQFGTPFIDVGVGVAHDGESLGGLVRVTESMSARPMADRRRTSLADPDPDNDYRLNIQIAELNALNAALAVIRWKKSLGFYRDVTSEHHSIFVIDQNDLVNEDTE